MSYIDETYGKQLEEALRGLVSRPALGQPWFGFHASEVPAGVLLFTATTHSRVLYADFWKYIQDKNLVKTEEEWQSIYSGQGWCPFYSDGDGIDTFRMPSAPLYLHGANTLGEAGQYTEAGLPNIEGLALVRGFANSDNHCVQRYGSGALYEITREPSDVMASGVDGGTFSYMGLDASRSSAVYGKSDTVTPETSKMLFGVWAISAPQQPISDATVEGIMSELNITSHIASEAKNGLNGVVRSVNGISADAAGNVVLGKGVYIIETWSNGTSWYRKWSDGWIEQGGQFKTTVTGLNTVSFFVEFRDVYYTVMNQTIYNNADGFCYNRFAHTKLTTGFKFDESVNVHFAWRAEGYAKGV